MKAKKTINSGKRAKHTGNRLELFCEQTLIEKGYKEFWNHKDQAFVNRQTMGGKQYAKQIFVGTTIYESKRKADFLVINQKLFPDGLVIECKWQQSGGSVDEKYPFLVLNIKKTVCPTIVLIDGGGYKASAKTWLTEQAHPNTALIGVWNMSEFQTKVNNGFLG